MILKSLSLASPDGTNYPLDAQHVFSWNSQVDTYNRKMMAVPNTPICYLYAIDARKYQQTGKANVTIPDNPFESGGLMETVSLYEGCRVMITKNICGRQLSQRGLWNCCWLY